MDIREMLLTSPLLSNDPGPVIPYSEAPPQQTQPDEWREIHSFAYGWGWHNPSRGQFLFVGDIARLLGFSAVPESVDLLPQATAEELCEQLAPLLAEEAEQQAEWLRLHPAKFDRISIPRIKTPA